MSAASSKKSPARAKQYLRAPFITKGEQTQHAQLLGSLKYGPRQAIIVTTLAFLISNVAAAFLILIYPLAQGLSSEATNKWLETSAWAQFGMFVSSSLVMAYVLYWYLRRKQQPLKQIGLSRPKTKQLLGGAAAFLPYLIVLAFVLAFVGAFIPAVDVAQQQEIFTAQTSGLEKLLPFIPLVLLAPLIEEALFRGFLYSGLRKRFSFLTVTLIVSVIFGALHLSASSDGPLWVAAIDTALLSFFLCYLRERTGSIWAGVALHFTKNFIAFLAVFVFM